MAVSTCKVNAVILAAGRSQRMGSDKLLLPLGKKTVLDQFLCRFPLSSFQHVVAVYSDKRVAGILRNYGVSLCCNNRPERGKSRSIRLGIAKGPAADGTMFSVADQPLLSRATVEVLLEVFALNRNRIVVPYSGGKPANPVIFPAALLPELNTLKNDTGGNTIIRKYNNLVSPIEIPSAEDFLDIDTRDDYHSLLLKWTPKN